MGAAECSVFIDLLVSHLKSFPFSVLCYPFFIIFAL